MSSNQITLTITTPTVNPLKVSIQDFQFPLHTRPISPAILDLVTLTGGKKIDELAEVVEFGLNTQPNVISEVSVGRETLVVNEQVTVEVVFKSVNPFEGI